MSGALPEPCEICGERGCRDYDHCENCRELHDLCTCGDFWAEDGETWA